MRKMVFGRKLSRSQKSRRALLRNLVTAIVINGKIVTTKAKAKAVFPMVDKLINIAKKNTVAARRDVFAKLGNHKATTDKIFELVKDNFTNKSGGYLTVVSLPLRRGDSSDIVRVQWSEALKVVKPEVKKAVSSKKLEKVAKKVITKPSKKVSIKVKTEKKLTAKKK